MIETADFNEKQHADLTIIIFRIAVCDRLNCHLFNNIPIEELSNS